MYNEFFGFREPPFSIAPDPRYLYLSDRHREALAHLMYGVRGQGGFIVITGEVGTGKTTICRGFIENVPEHVDIAMILNPRLSARELLSSICDELGLRHPSGSSIKRLIDLINHELLESHAAGRHKVLIIDEAQNLSADVLEQLRLLTNLETAEKKLLQIVLLGQPELRDILAQPELRQLAQRVTARYHLDAIERRELPAYLRYRQHVAGQQSEIFDQSALRTLYRRSNGIPRVINLICDRALLGAYGESTHQVRSRHIRQAAKEVLGDAGQTGSYRKGHGLRNATFATAIAAIIVLIWGVFEKSDLALVAGESEPSDAVQRASAQPETNQVNAKQTDKTSMAGSTDGDKRVSKDPATDSAVVEIVSDSRLGDGTVTDSDSRTSGSRTPDSRTEGAGESVAADTDDTLFTIDTNPRSDGQQAQDSSANPQWLDEANQSGTSKREAYRTLIAEWGFDYNASESPYACDFAETVGLRCLHRQGNWRSLEQLNRPTILKLFDTEGRVRHVTLTGLEGDKATVIHNGSAHDMTRAAIDRYWLGDYSLVWRVPPYDSRLVPDAESVSKEAWLSSKLMQLIASQEPSTARQDELMAASLNEQVRWFQGTNNLVQDGIVGAKTLIGMNRDLYPSVPTLSPRAKQTAEIR